MNLLVALPRYQYADEARGETHEYSSFLTALNQCFPEVYYLDTSEYILNSNIVDLNNELIKLQNDRQFTTIFVVQWGNEFFSETIALLRGTGATIVNWATDDSYRFDTFTKFIANRFNYTVTTEFFAINKYEKIGADCIKGHWAFSEQWKRPPMAADECKYDVAFIGVNYFDRKKYIDYLRAKGIRIFVGGYGWGKIGKIVAKEDIAETYNNSRVVINFSKSIGGRQTKARVFEAIAAGTCLLTEESPDLSQYFLIDNELLTFKSEDDCFQKIQLLLSDPGLRNRIAYNGYSRCIENYSYEKQFKAIFTSLPIKNKIVPIEEKEINCFVKKIKNPGKLRHFFRTLLFCTYTPILFQRAARKLESTFFKHNYLSAYSYTIY